MTHIYLGKISKVKYDVMTDMNSQQFFISYVGLQTVQNCDVQCYGRLNSPEICPKCWFK